MARALGKKTLGFANWDQNLQIYFSKRLASTNQIRHMGGIGRLGALLTGKTEGEVGRVAGACAIRIITAEYSTVKWRLAEKKLVKSDVRVAVC